MVLMNTLCMHHVLIVREHIIVCQIIFREQCIIMKLFERMAKSDFWC